MSLMRKSYCAPMVESISIRTYIVAASIDAARSVEKRDSGVDDGRGTWGSPWE